MSSFARVVVAFLTAARVSQQPHQATAHSARRAAAQKRTAPLGGRELKGAATAFRAWFGAARGTTAQAEAARERAFRGNRFSARGMPVDELVLERKIGGTENPEGARLRPGSRGAMRVEEGGRRRLVANACQGIRRQSQFLL